MAKIGAEPKVAFKRDGERYIVYLGDDRIGFVAQQEDERWNAVDTLMAKTATTITRRAAADWLGREYKRAVREGKI